MHAARHRAAPTRGAPYGKSSHGPWAPTRSPSFSRHHLSAPLCMASRSRLPTSRHAEPASRLYLETCRTRHHVLILRGSVLPPCARILKGGAHALGLYIHLPPPLRLASSGFTTRTPPQTTRVLPATVPRVSPTTRSSTFASPSSYTTRTSSSLTSNGRLVERHPLLDEPGPARVRAFQPLRPRIPFSGELPPMYFIFTRFLSHCRPLLSPSLLHA